MKNIVFVFVMVLMLGSCKDATKNLMPSVTGKINQVLVIAEKNMWDGAVGDTIREFFGQDQDGLPQAEPIFDVLNLPEKYFDKNMKGHRNVLQVVISPSVDSAYVRYADSPWAKTQKYVKIAAPDRKTFFKLFDENKLKILGIYAKAKGVRYLELTEGYINKLALDANDEVIGYQFVKLGKMMEDIRHGKTPNEAYEKNVGTYGRFSKEQGAVKYIDPREE